MTTTETSHPTRATAYELARRLVTEAMTESHRRASRQPEPGAPQAEWDHYSASLHWTTYALAAARALLALAEQDLTEADQFAARLNTTWNDPEAIKTQLNHLVTALDLGDLRARVQLGEITAVLP